MASPTVRAGGDLLVGALAHLDRHARTLCSFGLKSLASPRSPATAILTAFLTLFIAIDGIRPSNEPANVINAVLKIGIALTITLSWSAWRIVAYDVVFYGRPDIAATIMPSTLPDPRESLPQRLPGIDRGMPELTIAGTGRDTGQIIDLASGFGFVALADETGLGRARP